MTHLWPPSVQPGDHLCWTSLWISLLSDNKTCVASSQVNRTNIPGLVSSAGSQVPGRTPQRISCGFANPILFHFDLRQPLSLIWVRKYGLHRISTRHTQGAWIKYPALWPGKLVVLCPVFLSPKKASQQVAAFGLRSSFLAVALPLPQSARTDSVLCYAGSFRENDVTCWRHCHLWESAALGSMQKEKEVPLHQEYDQWVKFPERPAASQGSGCAPASQQPQIGIKGELLGTGAREEKTSDIFYISFPSSGLLHETQFT